MDWFSNLNLIHLFNFYLWLIFLLSTWLRFGQYQSIIALVRSVPGRWPRLFQLVKRHRNIFLTWTTVLPGLVALVLTIIQTLVSTLVWPEAGRPPHGLTIARLAQQGWPEIAAVCVLGCLMLCVDLYASVSVGAVDHAALQKYFDQAEYWLRSWTAHGVRVFTFGYVNPRHMVALEVRNALVEASRLINATLWWVSLQVSLRVAYGLALWLAYALATGHGLTLWAWRLVP